ncbi:sigma factor binding protein 1, chloroplastic-like [Tasmannia lanceolata]|uniref:sigma factor binding protein 1, chloroplastic-like n=1 Tax=Tasmannia lanceolata TaxID=3420 RepID=UPI004063CE33
MDKLGVVNHQKRKTKQPKSKKTPIKVVYISNPMKVKTSASQFRAIVQKLTGQDSDISDTSKFTEIDGTDGYRKTLDQAVAGTELDLVSPTPSVDPDSESSKSVVDSPFEYLDDFFPPQIFENFSGFFPSSSLYEPHVDFLGILDAV